MYDKKFRVVLCPPPLHQILASGDATGIKRK